MKYDDVLDKIEGMMAGHVPRTLEMPLSILEKLKNCKEFDVVKLYSELMLYSLKKNGDFYFLEKQEGSDDYHIIRNGVFYSTTMPLGRVCVRLLFDFELNPSEEGFVINSEARKKHGNRN